MFYHTSWYMMTFFDCCFDFALFLKVCFNYGTCICKLLWSTNGLDIQGFFVCFSFFIGLLSRLGWPRIWYVGRVALELMEMLGLMVCVTIPGMIRVSPELFLKNGFFFIFMYIGVLLECMSVWGCQISWK